MADLIGTQPDNMGMECMTVGDKHFVCIEDLLVAIRGIEAISGPGLRKILVGAIEELDAK